MARTSYLSRRDGRYFMQARFAVRCAPLVGLRLYRASLRTSEFRVARLRLSECLGWFHRMNESVDYISLFAKNVVELRAYLQDAWPLSEERLFARRNYEELLKNRAGSVCLNSFRAVAKWIPASVRLPSGLMTAH